MLMQTPMGAEAHLAGRILLGAAAPFQQIIDKASVTHHFLNQQAARILRADGLVSTALWIEVFLHELDAGSDWADSGWKNSFHMWDPMTGRGFKRWPNALEAARTYHDLALDRFRRQELTEAFFFLGAAAHVVQDLCVPQHAAVTLLENHRPFESYARLHRDAFAIQAGGLYEIGDTPEDWVAANARLARPLLGQVGSGSEPTQWWETLHTLLPRAQATTAGYFHQFLTQAGGV